MKVSSTFKPKKNEWSEWWWKFSTALPSSTSNPETVCSVQRMITKKQIEEKWKITEKLLNTTHDKSGASSEEMCVLEGPRL